MPDLSEQELDGLTRTVLGEASSNPMEQAAVAHAILNRASMGRASGYADDVNGVIHQPGAFEAWSHPYAKNYPGSFDPASTGYQQARKIVEGAASGQFPDPTAGYTHFLEPNEVGKRVAAGKMEWPSWAKQGGMQIGRQVFYPPTPKAVKAAQSSSDETIGRLLQSGTTADKEDEAGANEAMDRLMGMGQHEDSAAAAPTPATSKSKEMSAQDRIEQGFEQIPFHRGTEADMRLYRFVKDNPELAATLGIAGTEALTGGLGLVPLLGEKALTSGPAAVKGGASALWNLLKMGLHGTMIGQGIAHSEDIAGVLKGLIRGGH